MRRLLSVVLCLTFVVGWADTEQALRDAGARDHEVLAAQIQSVGSSMSHLRQIDSLIETDCGAFGVYHMQPHQAEAWGITSDLACPIEDPKWVSRMEAFLRSHRSATLQLETWRRIVAPVARACRHLPTEEKAAVLALANTGPARILYFGELTGWNVERMMEWYVADRPTEHRYRRVNYIRAEVLGLEPLVACPVIYPLTL
jgi:hypothetical protein